MFLSLGILFFFMFVLILQMKKPTYSKEASGYELNRSEGWRKSAGSSPLTPTESKDKENLRESVQGMEKEGGGKGKVLVFYHSKTKSPIPKVSLFLCKAIDGAFLESKTPIAISNRKGEVAFSLPSNPSKDEGKTLIAYKSGFLAKAIALNSNQKKYFLTPSPPLTFVCKNPEGKLIRNCAVVLSKLQDSIRPQFPAQPLETLLRNGRYGEIQGIFKVGS